MALLKQPRLTQPIPPVDAATKPEAPTSATPAAGLQPGDLLSPKQAARAMGIGIGLLRAWRRDGAGLKHIALSPRVTRYRREDIDAFLASRISGGA